MPWLDGKDAADATPALSKEEAYGYSLRFTSTAIIGNLMIDLSGKLWIIETILAIRGKNLTASPGVLKALPLSRAASSTVISITHYQQNFDSFSPFVSQVIPYLQFPGRWLLTLGKLKQC